MEVEFSEIVEENGATYVLATNGQKLLIEGTARIVWGQERTATDWTSDSAPDCLFLQQP